MLPVVPFYAPSVTLPIELPTNNITYRVDMTEQIQLGNFIPSSGVDTIRVTGNPVALTSWGNGVDMTNNPALSGDASNIYSAVIGIQGIPGALGGEHKFRMNSAWEDTSDGYNRNFTIIGGNQVLPIRYYNDQPVGPATNANVTFQVDMTPQVISGGFTNGVSTVTISGNINGWGNGSAMTNDPALSGNASNVYSTTVSTATTSVGMWCRYKFRADSGWEAAAIYGVNGNKDRRFYYTGGDQILPLVTYNDASLCDLLLKDTTVTFVLQLTNGTPDTAGIPFDKVNDKVYINGEFLKWLPWNNSLPEMTNNPVGSDLYQQTFVITAGTSRQLHFKYGVDGPGHGALDNENVTYIDHYQYVRNNNNPYTMATSQFGTNFTSSLIEPLFGSLKAGAPSGGHIPVTWVGCACVTLQTKSSLAPGAWTDLPATDATSSTNYPNSGGQQYFRLQKRPLP
jgi:hypothetical protein